MAMDLRMHLYRLCHSKKEKIEMNSSCEANNSCEAASPKHFMIWVVLWIAALMVLLPALAGS